jgi:hypothetical protein
MSMALFAAAFATFRIDFEALAQPAPHFQPVISLHAAHAKMLICGVYTRARRAEHAEPGPRVS